MPQTRQQQQAWGIRRQSPGNLLMDLKKRSHADRLTNLRRSRSKDGAATYKCRGDCRRRRSKRRRLRCGASEWIY